jgi:hypothetical protein
LFRWRSVVCHGVPVLDANLACIRKLGCVRDPSRHLVQSQDYCVHSSTSRLQMKLSVPTTNPAQINPCRHAAIYRRGIRAYAPAAPIHFDRCCLAQAAYASLVQNKMSAFPTSISAENSSLSSLCMPDWKIEKTRL